MAKLARLAEANPDVQKKIREKLRGASGAVGIVPSEPTPEANKDPPLGTATGEAPENLRASQPMPASPVRNEILTRMQTLTVAHAELQARWAKQKEALEAADRSAAALREEASRRERELGAERQRSASLRVECDNLRRLGVCREVFRSASKNGAELSLHWAEAWDWPGGNASVLGVRQLRRSMDGRSAELSVGPPPAGWRNWLQLGIRRGQPAEPSLLRLRIPGASEAAAVAEDCCDTYMGLLWPAPAA